MMRRLLNLVLVVTASFSAVVSADAKSVEDPRMQMIWDSAYNRMAEQASIWYDAPWMACTLAAAMPSTTKPMWLTDE